MQLKPLPSHLLPQCEEHALKASLPIGDMCKLQTHSSLGLRACPLPLQWRYLAHERVSHAAPELDTATHKKRARVILIHAHHLRVVVAQLARIARPDAHDDLHMRAGAACVRV